MTVLLMLAIFYIGYMLTSAPEKTSSVAPRKTKAQDAGYSRVIPLAVTISVSPTIGISTSPTPTEIILAYQNPTVTGSVSTPSATVTASTSPTPTKTTTLPKSGFINNAIVLFGVSALVIFISFIF